jgi:hypothetical protein
MKNIVYIIVFVIGIQHSFAQDKNTLYLTYAYSGAMPVNNKRLEGAPGYDGKAASTFGLRIIARSHNIVSFESGLDFVSASFAVRPAFYPGTEMTPRRETLSLLSVPVYANLRFLKYFFVNGGALLDFDVTNKHGNTVKDKTGLGFGVGIGGRYNLKKISILINPFFQSHGYFSLNQSGTGQSLFNAGGRVGLGYRF